VKALARAFRWRRLLEEGRYASIREFAAAVRRRVARGARERRIHVDEGVTRLAQVRDGNVDGTGLDRRAQQGCLVSARQATDGCNGLDHRIRI